MTQEVDQAQSIAENNNRISSHDAKDINDKPSDVTSDPLPKDKFNFVYLLFLFLGMCTLLPMNMFLIATPYFSAKLNGTRWQYTYQNYFLVAYSIPAVIASTVILPLLRFINLKIRMIVAPTVIMVVFIITTIMVKVDTSTWIDSFFIILIIGSILINSFGASVYQSSLFGLVSFFPKQYSQSVAGGQALAGIFTSLASIFSLVGSSDPYQSAVAYFTCAIGALLVCVLSYVLLGHIEYSRYYMQKLKNVKPKDAKDGVGFSTRHGLLSILPAMQLYNADDSPSSGGHVISIFPGINYQNHQIFGKTATGSGQNNSPDGSGTAEGQAYSKRSFYQIWKKTWPMAITGVLSITVTLGAYPAVTSRIQSTNSMSNNTFFTTFFTPVACFLTYNVADFIGRFLGLWLLLPSHKHGITLLLIAILRSGFIPVFLFCNAQPRTWLPVLIESDIVFVVSLAIFALTNGYIISLAMMYAPMRVGTEHAETTGAIMAAGLIVGLGFGSGLSFAVVAIL